MVDLKKQRANCLSTMLNQNKIYLAILTSSFADFNFDVVVLEIYHELQDGLNCIQYSLSALWSLSYKTIKPNPLGH